MRRTLASLMPAARAIVRVDQWVAFAGVSSSAIFATAFTCRSVMMRVLPWPRTVLLQSGDPALKKTAPPARHLLRRHPHPLGNLLVLQTIGGQKHDPRPLYKPGWLGSLTRQTLQRRSLFETQFNQGCRAHRDVLYQRGRARQILVIIYDALH